MFISVQSHFLSVYKFLAHQFILCDADSTGHKGMKMSKKHIAALDQLAALEEIIGESSELSALRAKLYELIGRKYHTKKCG